MAETLIFMCSLLLDPIKLTKPRATRDVENLKKKSNLFLTDPESQKLIFTQNYAFMKNL